MEIEYKVGDEVFFFVDFPSDAVSCGKCKIKKIKSIPENEIIFYHTDMGVFNDQEVFASWEDVAKAACSTLKRVYKNYE